MAMPMDEMQLQDTNPQEENPGSAPMGAAEDTEDDDRLRALIESTNIAEKLDEEKIQEISRQCKDGFEFDLESRSDWDKASKEWTKLALQIREEKTYPWVGASNVKYPLLSTAAMQFNARAYPSLVPADNKVGKWRAVGADTDGQKAERARRLGLH